MTMVVFSDFQCPYCARATPAVKEHRDAYPNDVRIVWKHLPLPFHPNAMPAALAAEAAREQGGAPKFWAMHDKLFANQAALSEATYEQYARELGLDQARFKKDLADPAAPGAGPRGRAARPDARRERHADVRGERREGGRVGGAEGRCRAAALGARAQVGSRLRLRH